MDTLIQFADVNEELFWNTASKNYPFSPDEIEKYKEDIDFYYLSGNENIDWTLDIIKTYEPYLSKTYQLQRNKRIQWNESLIKNFLDSDWLDWSELYFNRELTISKQLYEKEKRNFITTKFIIKESIDSITFYYEHDYFTKERYFQDYIRNWYQEGDSTRVKSYKKLKPYFDKNISSVPIDTIIKYNDEINWHDFTSFAEMSWNWENFIMLYPYLQQWIIPDNKFLYDQLFRLDSTTLSILHQTFQKKNRNFIIEYGDDRYGTAPRIDVKKTGYPYYIRLNEEFDIKKSFPQTISDFRFEVGHSSGGPKRFLDIMFLYNDQNFPSFICSKKVKSILQNHSLPSHKFYPIQVYLDSYWYGKDTLDYFLFITNNKYLDRDLKLDSIKLRDVRNILSPFDSIETDTLSINSLNQFHKFLEPRYNYNNYNYKILTQIHLKSFYDLNTIMGDKIHVSKRLRNSLEMANVSGLKYIKDYSLDWHIEAVKSKIIDISKIDNKMSLSTQKTIMFYEKAKEKQKKIELNWNNVLELYQNIDRDKLDSIELKIMDMEIKWDVQFPEEYRKILLTNEKPKLGQDLRDYEFFPINNVEQVGKEWYIDIPQTFKGILIAGNGIGDHLMLLLDNNSSYKLSNTLYKAEHEIGELIESIKLE